MNMQIVDMAIEERKIPKKCQQMKVALDMDTTERNCSWLVTGITKLKRMRLHFLIENRFKNIVRCEVVI